MGNLEEAERLANRYPRGKSFKWSQTDIRQVVYGMLEAYDGPTEEPLSKCHKPKIKLEVGCKVQCDIGKFRHNPQNLETLPGTVLSMHGTEAWVIDDKGNRRTFGVRELAVIEAATPEIGDCVQTGGGLRGIVLCITKAPNRWYSVSIKGQMGDYRRDTFTITHKAKP